MPLFSTCRSCNFVYQGKTMDMASQGVLPGACLLFAVADLSTVGAAASGSSVPFDSGYISSTGSGGGSGGGVSGGGGGQGTEGKQRGLARLARCVHGLMLDCSSWVVPAHLG